MGASKRAVYLPDVASNGLTQHLLCSPRNYQELFNLRHTQLRNIIERIFGVFKKRFKVLVIPQEYNIKTQAKLVSALAVLHNFIRIHDPEDLPNENADHDNHEDVIHGRL